MGYYYIRMLLGVPKALWDASDVWSRLVVLGLIVGSIMPWVADVARASLSFWWIAPVSFGTLVIFGIARLNYEEIEALRRRATDADAHASAAESGLREVQDRRPVLKLGRPIIEGNGVLPRTEVRGDRQTGVGWEGAPARYVKNSRHIVNYRVPITNRGASCEVRVKVVEIEPDVDGVRLPITPHVAGDDPSPNALKREFKEAFPLARDETVLVDVVARDLDDAAMCYLWNIAFEDAVQEVLLGGTHLLTLTAYAGDVNTQAVYQTYAGGTLARLEMKGPLVPRARNGE